MSLSKNKCVNIKFDAEKSHQKTIWDLFRNHKSVLHQFALETNNQIHLFNAIVPRQLVFRSTLSYEYLFSSTLSLYQKKLILFFEHKIPTGNNRGIIVQYKADF